MRDLLTEELYITTMKTKKQKVADISTVASITVHIVGSGAIGAPKSVHVFSDQTR